MMQLRKISDAAGGSQKTRLVILGAGFGGFRLAQEIDYRAYDVILISPRNYFLFTPLLASSTVGTVEFRSIIEPVRRLSPPLQFIEASCIGIDPETKAVRCRGTESDEFSVSFDLLVIAIGSTSNTFGLPGVMEHSLFLKDLSDARKIRKRVVELLEHASLPSLSHEERGRLLTFVIVGGGPTGVEVAAELRDLANEELKERFSSVASFVRIVLLEAKGELLGSFNKRLRDYTLYRFRKLGIDVRTDTAVKAVSERSVSLTAGEVLPAGLVIWTAGITLPPLLRDSPFPRDPLGRLITTPYLSLPDTSQIYAIGDCAAVKDKNFPMTAQLAEQQARYLARTLNGLVKGRPARPFTFLDLGMLAYIGAHRGVADLPLVKGYGLVAWFFWRAVYLTKIVSLRNRLLILFDWFKAAVFGRDISAF